MNPPGKGKVLFVDDSHGSAFLFMLAVRHLGYEVEYQEDADRALQMFETMASGNLELPDAIILDIFFENLPPKSPLRTRETAYGRLAGVHLAKVLKSNPRTAQIPTLAMTSFDIVGGLPPGVEIVRRYDISPLEFAERIDQAIRNATAR